MIIKASGIVTAFLFSVSAWAQVPAFSGEWVMDMAPELLKRVDYETVVARDPQASSRLDILRSTGYECEPRGSDFYRCMRHSAETALPEEIRERALQHNQAQDRIRFLAVDGPTELVHESPHYREWKIRQALEFAGAKYLEYFYSESVDGITKIKSSQGSADLELLVTEPKRLQRYVQETEAGADWKSWSVFHVLLNYRPSLR